MKRSHAAIALSLFGLSPFVACDRREALVSQVASPADTFALTSDWTAFAQTATPQVDLLFMVDNSLSMAPLQRKLVEGFSSFVTALQSLPGGTPDVHLAVVTSDLGAGQYSEADIMGCRPGGDQGVFQTAPKGSTCASGMLNAGQSFLAGSSASGPANYTGDLAAAFGCLALVGDLGCGFEHQLASVLRALGADGQPAPAQNAGFLRANALLGVVLLTDEDDCSAPPDATVFDPASRLVSDKYGPLASFRCNEFGHLCRVGGKLVRPSQTVAATYDGCVSNESGPLDKVGDFVAALEALKSDPAQVFFAAITGPATPYSVVLGPPQAKDDVARWPSVAHSCISADGTYADPSVRVVQAVQSFGAHGMMASICDDTMGPTLNRIATAFSRPLAAPCVPTPAPSGPGCTVVDRWTDDTGTKVAARLPSCDVAAGALPCWELVADDATCGPTSRRLDVRRGGAALAAGLVTAIDCTARHP